jgi:hypothetical protein
MALTSGRRYNQENVEDVRMKAKNLMNCALALVIAAMSGCGIPSTGYKKINGKWSYVTWDTAAGTAVHDLKADNDTFLVLGVGEYAKDRRRVFYGSSDIEGADPATFELLDAKPYSKDKVNVYLFKHRIRGADPATFKVFASPYGRDASKAFCGTVPMDVDDIDSLQLAKDFGGWSTTYNRDAFAFEFGDSFDDLQISHDNPAVTGNAWACDGKHFYFGPARVVGADYASFKIFDSYSSEDKNRKYMWAFPARALLERRRRFLGLD